MTDPMTAVAAVLVATNIAGLVGWRRALNRRDLLATLNEELNRYLDAAHRRYWDLWHNARQIAAARIDVEDRLRTIERQRSNTTRKGNATRAAKAKALRDAKTSELRRDLQASLAEAERLAA